MTKKRRTREEKIRAGRRQDLTGLLVNQPLINEARATIQDIKPPQAPVATRTYSYVVSDIGKTLIITSLLAMLNIIVYAALKFRFISFFDLEF